MESSSAFVKPPKVLVGPPNTVSKSEVSHDIPRVTDVPDGLNEEVVANSVTPLKRVTSRTPLTSSE